MVEINLQKTIRASTAEKFTTLEEFVKKLSSNECKASDWKKFQIKLEDEAKLNNRTIALSEQFDQDLVNIERVPEELGMIITIALLYITRVQAKYIEDNQATLTKTDKSKLNSLKIWEKTLQKVQREFSLQSLTSRAANQPDVGSQSNGTGGGRNPNKTRKSRVGPR